MKNSGTSLALLIIVSSVIVLPVKAGTVLQAIDKCSKVENSLQRLNCYDGIANGINKETVVIEDPQVVAPVKAKIERTVPSVVAPAPALTVTSVVSSKVPGEPKNMTKDTNQAQQNFGIEQQLIAQQSIDKIYATVVKVTKDGRKKRVFTMDNGQVWRQTQSDSLKIKQGDVIYIDRGILGSFYMSKDDVNRKFKVKRIK